MSSLAFLVTELQALASETRRKHPDVREAAEKSLAILRSSPEQATQHLASDGPHSEDLLRPVFMGCATRNAKVVGISLGSLQRLISLRAVPLSAVPMIITTMNDCMSQGVDIQLKILQTLLSLITNFPSVHGQLLADALLVCFKLHESRIAVVSSTAAATLRQLVMFVVDKVVEEDRQDAADLGDITLPDGTTKALGPSARDAFAIVQDLCLLANSEKPRILKLDFLHKTFALELIESVLTNYDELFREHAELIILLQHHVCPMLHKLLSDRPVFPLTLRSTRVIFLLLKQFSAELVTEAEVFLTLLIKIIGGDDGGPHWMRVLALEIVRGLCNDAGFVRAIWLRYDGKEESEGEGVGASVFTMLVSALKRIVTEKPALLGISQQMLGVNVPQVEGGGVYGLDGVAGMVATAASATMSNVVGMMGSEAGLSASSAMKLQCIDQLDKADAPPIPDAYVYLLGVHCLVSLCEGFATYTAPIYTQLVVQKPRTAGDAVVRAPGALDPSTLPDTEPSRTGLIAVRNMVNAGWPALLAALSFLLSTNLSDDLFADVLAAYQSLTNVAGMLALPTPRDALLSGLAKAAIPARVVSALESYIEPSTPRSASSFTENLGLVHAQQAQPGLSERNLACLKVLVGSALFLAGSLGESWFNVLEALQNADYVLTSKGAKGPGQPMTKRSISQRSMSQSGIQFSPQAPRHPLLSDLEADSIQLGIQRLFDSSKNLEDVAFKDFVEALCKLSAAMIDMLSMNDLNLAPYSSSEFDTIPEESATVTGSSTSLADPPMSPTSTLTPRPSHMSRRRVSGIHLPRTLRTGDFGISKLSGVAIMNIHRLIYRAPSIAWDTITSHLLFVLRNPGAPQAIRLQAATTLDEILVAAPRNLGAAHDIRSAVQRRVLDALSQQIMLDPQTNSSANVDLRKMGLETLHEILQASGHTLVVGWETIFEMLSSVCLPAIPTSLSSSNVTSPTQSPASMGRSKPLPLGYGHERGYTSLVKIAFQSLTLVCDSLSALSPSHLRLCIATLGAFGRQADTNIALTAAESLFWGVSDSIQAKRKDATQEPEYSSLWMCLLLEILELCTDARPEVRTGAIQTLFRTLQLYGGTLSGETWDECLWRVTFPLLDSLTTAVRTASVDEANEEGGKWAESKVVALQAVGGIFTDFLQVKLMRLSSYERAWSAFVLHVRDAFLLDGSSVGAPALKCLERALRAVREAAKEEQLGEQVRSSFEATWAACDEMGGPVIKRAGPLPFSQESLAELVSVIRATRAASYSLQNTEWPLERLERLMSILKGVLTYPLSSDYRPDVDVLMPVQAAVMECIESIDLGVAGAPSLVLTDLSELGTLAFLAAFDVKSTGSMKKRVTYVALAKKTMPLLVELFLRFKDALEVYSQGTLEAILGAYSIPIKLKYECPAPSKFASNARDMPLWKTATTCFLRVAREVAGAIQRFATELPDDRVEGIWRQTIDVFRGGILADCSAAETMPLDLQESEEAFDLSLIAALEIDVVPYLGDVRVPDALVLQLARVLQQGSQIRLPSDDGDESSVYASPPSTPTREAVEGQRSYVLRERFAYWCFDLLFLVCSDTAKDNEVARRRVAALCLPSLLGRCQATLVSFIADEAVRGSLPFPRAREEELLYVLQKLLDLRLWEGSMAAALSDSPSALANDLRPVKASLPPADLLTAAHRRSPRAHLFHFYSVLCEIAALPRPLPIAFVREGSLSKAGVAGAGTDGKVGEEMVVRPEPGVGEAVVERDARKIARECLRDVGRELGVPR